MQKILRLSIAGVLVASTALAGILTDKVQMGTGGAVTSTIAPSVQGVVTNGIGSGASTVTISNGFIQVTSPDYSVYGNSIAALTYRCNQSDVSFGELALVVDAQYATPPFQFAQADYFTDQALYDAGDSANVVYSPANDYYTVAALPSIPKANGFHFKMNDSAADHTVVDANSHNVGAAYQNTSILTHAGKINNALTFDGIHDCVVVAGASTPVGSTDWAIMMWVYPTSVYPGGDIATHSSDTTAGHFRFGNPTGATPTNLMGVVFDSGVAPHSTSPEGCVWLNTWQHVALVKSTNTLICYKNGAVVGTCDMTGVTAMGNTDPLILGRNNHTPGYQFFTGYMDDVRYFTNMTISTADILAIYNAGVGTENETTPLPYVYYTLDENAGTMTVTDSMHGNNATASANTSTMHAAGKINGALYMGANGVAATSFTGILGSNATISCWYKLDINAMGWDSGHDLLTWGNAALTFYQARGLPTLRNQLGAEALDINNTSMTNGAWHHLAWVQDGAKLATLYLDGVSVGTKTFGAFPGASSVFKMGKATYPFNGTIDDVRVWGSALSSSEILAIYTAAAPPATSAVGLLQATPLVTATNCTSGMLQVLADTAGYNSGAYNAASATSLLAKVSADNGTTFTNAPLVYAGPWTDPTYVSFRSAVTFPVAGSQLVYRVIMSNNCPAKVKGSIVWGIP